ncbi:MAG: response regulator [Labilithrix sp.]|nr:response regulator [Labilithrix sp.]
MHYSFASYELDTLRFELRLHGVICRLQPKPLDLLTFLVENRARVVLKSELLAHLWPGVSVTENALAQAVASVRDAISDAGSDAIVCVRGRGYRFAVPVIERVARMPSAPPGARAPAPAVARRLAESIAGTASFLVNAHERAALSALLEGAASNGTTVVRVAAISTGPLSTFRNLVAMIAAALPHARIGRERLADWVASAPDEHAFVEGVLALFRGDWLEHSMLIVEDLERADIASVLLFGMLAPTRRPGRLLLATCSFDGEHRQELLGVERLVDPRVRHAS